MIGKCVFRSQNKRQFAWALARRWLNVGTVRWAQIVVTSQVLAHKSQRFVCAAHETMIFIGNAGDCKSLLDPWVRLDNLDLHCTWSGSLIKINIFSCVKQCTIHWKRFSIEAWTEEKQKQNHINDVPLDLLLSFSIMNLHHAVRLSVLAKCSSIKLPWTTHSQTVVHHWKAPKTDIWKKSTAKREASGTR